MSSGARQVRGQHQKNIARSFDSLSQKYTRWQVWADFIMMSAISISNAVDLGHKDKREETYRSVAKRYSAGECKAFGEMFTETVLGMEESVDQDFLGELFMALELSNERVGQFFTPYEVCFMMAQMTSTDLQQRIKEDHWISVNDPACGAGALLLAMANECTRQDINYQTSVLFTAQDIDLISGCMCYIQLSLLGCPGYVVIGDTLAHPSTSYDPRGLLPRDGGNVWYTPLYFTEIWHYRKLLAKIDLMCRSTDKAPENAEMSAAPEFSKKSEQPGLKTTKTGQLTLF